MFTHKVAEAVADPILTPYYFALAVGILAGIVSILISISVGLRNGTFAAVVAVLGTVALGFVVNQYDPSLKYWPVENPLAAAIYAVAGAAAYVSAGLVWSVTAWLWFCRRLRVRILDRKAAGHTSALSPEYHEMWKGEIPAQAKKYKQDFVRWTAYWPFSIVATVVEFVFTDFLSGIIKLVQRFYGRVVAVMTHTYQAISNWMFQGL